MCLVRLCVKAYLSMGKEAIYIEYVTRGHIYVFLTYYGGGE